MTTLFTLFTSGHEGEVNRIIDRRRYSVPLLFTSFTSFSKGGVIHVGAGAGALARINLSPLREWSERGEQEGVNAPQSVDYPVHFTVFGEVNERLQFTSAGERRVSS